VCVHDMQSRGRGGGRVRHCVDLCDGMVARSVGPAQWPHKPRCCQLIQVGTGSANEHFLVVSGIDELVSRGHRV